MTFPYPLFPVSMAFGFQSGFDYGNELMTLNSGAVVSGPTRDSAQRLFEFSYSTRDHIDVDAIRDAMHDSRFSALPILIRDWADYQATAEEFGTGDGTSAPFPLYKTYGTLNPISRLIRYPDPDDLVVYENGVEKAIASVDEFGVIPTAPWTAAAVLTWTGTFYVPVRLSSIGVIQVTGPQGRHAALPRLAAIEDLAA